MDPNQLFHCWKRKAGSPLTTKKAALGIMGPAEAKVLQDVGCNMEHIMEGETERKKLAGFNPSYYLDNIANILGMTCIFPFADSVRN